MPPREPARSHAVHCQASSRGKPHPGHRHGCRPLPLHAAPATDAAPVRLRAGRRRADRQRQLRRLFRRLDARGTGLQGHGAPAGLPGRPHRERRHHDPDGRHRQRHALADPANPVRPRQRFRDDLGDAGIVAEKLAAVGEEGRLAWVFGGVGAGIAASGLVVHLLVSTLYSSTLWVLVGAITAVLAPVALILVRERDLPASRRVADPRRRVPRPLPFWPLFVGYTLQGLGYSVFATFIVALIKTRPGIEDLGDWVWIVTGLAILPSCLFWSRIAERIGFSLALVTAYLAQIVGVLLPVVSGAPAAALLGAVLFGGTFIAITLLTMPLGRNGLGGRGFAVLTAGFGLGQMVGPYVAGKLVAGAADYTLPLAASAGVLAAGLLAVLWAIRGRAS
ncbi:MAG: hypothetical protein CMP81_23780 [Fulvimarina sp.]|nr:hypothetical protein [Fulvimarina sp.]